MSEQSGGVVNDAEAPVPTTDYKFGMAVGAMLGIPVGVAVGMIAAIVGGL